jgi:hypothetical protein
LHFLPTCLSLIPSGGYAHETFHSYIRAGDPARALVGTSWARMPTRIEPITDQGIRYVVPNDKGRHAYLQAWDVQTGRKLWTKTIFRHWYIPMIGSECMFFEYLDSMTIEGGQLKLISERGRQYALNVQTRKLRRLKQN